MSSQVCEACCKGLLPNGPRLNPVIASLVFNAAEQALNRGSLSVRDQVLAHDSKQFATRWIDAKFATAPSTEFDSLDADSIDPPRQKEALRIGLVGADSGFGLNHQNRDIAIHLGIDRWLIPGKSDQQPEATTYRIDTVPQTLSPTEIAAWLKGLDVVLFVERPTFAGLTTIARQCGVKVVCVPNWEWLHPGLDWLCDVDLMLCPTRYTAQLMSSWKAQFRFDWNVVCQPWPIDIDRFQYRRRWFCRRFVYVHGSGGAPAFDRNAKSRDFQRKGFDVLLAAARQIPHIPIVAYAAPPESTSLPANIDFRPRPQKNSDLYHEGDVCLQPSHWEGLGLPLLECQAAGMPLVTTDLAPMNEHQPWGVIPVDREEAVYLSSDLCIPVARIQPEVLADRMRALHRSFIGFASSRARRFVERHHNWRIAAPQILQEFQNLISQSFSQMTSSR